MVELSEKLTRLELERKITEILFSWRFWFERRTVAFTDPLRPSTMFINLSYRQIHSPKFWINNLVTILTHENIHRIIAKIIDEKTCKQLDNLFEYIPENNFFVDGDWKWIEK